MRAVIPRFAIIQNASRPLTVPARVAYCHSFSCRWRGLMLQHGDLKSGTGLLIAWQGEARLSASIHTFFVPFDLSVFWINTNMMVVDRMLARAWRTIHIPCSAAKYTLEMHPADIDEFKPGDKIKIDFLN